MSLAAKVISFVAFEFLLASLHLFRTEAAKARPWQTTLLRACPVTSVGYHLQALRIFQTDDSDSDQNRQADIRECSVSSIELTDTHVMPDLRSPLSAFGRLLLVCPSSSSSSTPAVAFMPGLKGMRVRARLNSDARFRNRPLQIAPAPAESRRIDIHPEQELLNVRIRAANSGQASTKVHHLRQPLHVDVRPLRIAMFDLVRCAEGDCREDLVGEGAAGMAQGLVDAARDVLLKAEHADPCFTLHVSLLAG